MHKRRYEKIYLATKQCFVGESTQGVNYAWLPEMALSSDEAATDGDGQIWGGMDPPAAPAVHAVFLLTFVCSFWLTAALTTRADCFRPTAAGQRIYLSICGVRMFWL